MSLGIELAERGWLPDWIVRRGIRRLLTERLRQQDRGDCATNRRAQQAFAESLRRGPLAVHQQAANQQHYEVPTALYQHMLGPRMKYSCCYWPAGVDTLAAAEDAMLERTANHAQLADGQRILDLGCGWGALALWAAARYPHAHVTALSNSRTQREYILTQAESAGLANLEVLTGDVSRLDFRQRFDRVVSVEMFEHFRNYEQLLANIATWLEPDGKLLVHVFCHREFAYAYEDAGADDWMARHFFSGGIMPSDALLLGFQRDLVVSDHWRFSGLHYQRTLEAWLQRLDAHRGELEPLLAPLADGDARRAVQRWRIFLLACSELFGYRSGQEWYVSHYLFEPRSVPGRPVDAPARAGSSTV